MKNIVYVVLFFWKYYEIVVFLKKVFVENPYKILKLFRKYYICVYAQKWCEMLWDFVK